LKSWGTRKRITTVLPKKGVERKDSRKKGCYRKMKQSSRVSSTGCCCLRRENPNELKHIYVNSRGQSRLGVMGITLEKRSRGYGPFPLLQPRREKWRNKLWRSATIERRTGATS